MEQIKLCLVLLLDVRNKLQVIMSIFVLRRNEPLITAIKVRCCLRARQMVCIYNTCNVSLHYIMCRLNRTTIEL